MSALNGARSTELTGRKSIRTVNGTTTVFVTDAGNREVLEYDGASGAIQRWYAYGLGSNDVLNQTNVVAGTRAAFIPDIQGSVIASLDSSSGALSKVGYLPYGKSANTMAPFGYTAQRIDPETNGLYYYRARHYSAAWGRFMQPDPVGYSGESHLYAYVNDDPLNNTDPSGQDLVGAVVGAFAGGYYGVLGAYSAGGGLTEAVIGGAVGAIAGSVIGALPPTLSVQTLTAVGGAAGFAGDITGQVIALALAGKPLADINWGSAAGATVGGAISGFGGAVLGRLALSTGAPPVLSAIAGASIPATPSVLLPIIGANIYNNLSGTPK